MRSLIGVDSQHLLSRLFFERDATLVAKNPIARSSRISNRGSMLHENLAQFSLQINSIKACKLKRLPIAVPPLTEQRRIVAEVDQLMALVDQLETQLAKSRAAVEKLLEAVVAGLTSLACARNSKARLEKTGRARVISV